MRFGQSILVVSALAIASAVPSFAATPKVRRGPTAPRTSKPQKPHASIDPERATQIQVALIHAGYLTGTPSGTWDAQTQAAMEKLQADNGWQTKIVPDARAIIKLGLGPTSQPAEFTATLPASEGREEPAAVPEQTAAPAASNK